MKEKFDLVIEAGKKRKLYWRDFINSREILFFLAWRDLTVRYKQTVIGILWSLLQPTLNLVIFVFVFSKIARLPTASGSPYAIMVFAGLLPWQFFANSVTQSSQSLINNANLVSKIYFPRMILPLSSIAACLVDFVISLFVFFFLMAFYKFVPGIQVLLMPLFLLQCMLLIIGIGFFVSALNVKYRDFRILVPFALQVGMYISSVGFSSHLVPERFRFIYSLNPMVGIIEGFRWCILGEPVYLPGMISSVVVTLGVLYVGYMVFKKIESYMADYI
jgi:lipopolysaccharide transport system permease protein